MVSVLLFCATYFDWLQAGEAAIKEMKTPGYISSRLNWLRIRFTLDCEEEEEEGVHQNKPPSGRHTKDAQKSKKASTDRQEGRKAM